MSPAKFLNLCASRPWSEVRSALENGCDPNTADEHGVSALMEAAGNNTPDVVSGLLEHGAHINVKDSGGRTALMYAAAHNMNFEVIRLLIKSGASVNARDNSGKTPLMHAAEYNREHLVIRELIDSRAFVNARTKDGQTPLVFAVRRANPRPEIVEDLLSSWANPNITLDGRRLECFAKDSPYLRGTRALRLLREND